MASIARVKPTRRATVSPVAKGRTAAGAAKADGMKGLVKVGQVRSPPKTAAKARTVKTSAAQPAPSRKAVVARKAAAGAKTPSRKPISAATPARKAAAKRAQPVKKPVQGKAASANPAKTADREPAPAKPRATQAAKAKPAPRTSAARMDPVPSPEQIAREREAAREMAREIVAGGINRALDLLEVLARGGPVPLAVLTETARCGKSAALEALHALQARDFVIQDEANGLWRLGARWAVLGSAASEQGALAATAMPFLIGLGHATGENVYIRVREGLEVETAAIYQTDPNLRIYTEVGKRMPLHAGSGRLLLAHAPEAVQTQVLAQRLQRYTPSTRIDPTWIAADLHRIRQRGYVITDSEIVAGTVTVGAPVRDASGQVIAVMLIAAPSLRMRPPRPRGLLPAVLEACRKLSRALGADIPEPPPALPVKTGPESRRQTQTTAAVPRASPAAPATTASATPLASTITSPGALTAAIARPHSIFR